MSFYILLLLLVSLVISAMTLHYGFDLLGALPEAVSKENTNQEFFKLNYTFYLNLVFLAITALFAYWKFSNKSEHHHKHEMASKGSFEKVLKVIAVIAFLWLGIGLVLKFFM
jgi:heme/copper-type cytochrome/quinol oxidase subunit 2